MALQTGLLILLGHDAGTWGWDQTQYHLPTIEEFAGQLPAPDLVNYKSATSPGWHLLLALFMKAGVGVTGLRCIAALAGILLLLVATHTAARWVAPRSAALLLLPLALTPYAVGGSAWVTTDVPALACVALTLAAITAGLTTTRAGRDTGRSTAGQGTLKPHTPARIWLWLGALAAAAGVAIRQPTAWLAVPIALRALMERRWLGLTALIWPVGMLGVLVWAWGGLMPPAYRSLHGAGANPAAIALMLALAACWGAPLAMALTLAHGKRGAGQTGAGDLSVPPSAWWTRTWLLAALAAAAALLYTAAIPTSATTPDDGGRCFGPLWELVRRMPAPGERSLVMLLLAPIGGAALTLLWRFAAWRGNTRAATILLVSLGMAAAANAANSQAWERYADLPLLLLLPWLAALGAAPKAASGAAPRSAPRAMQGTTSGERHAPDAKELAADARAGSLLGWAALLVALMQMGIAGVNLWKPAFTPRAEPIVLLAPVPGEHP